jgi:uncharacterized protein YkwD
MLAPREILMRPSLAIGCLILCGSAWAVQDNAKQEKTQEYKLSAEEKQIIDMTNAERKKHDLPPLKINLTLCKVARDHAVNQAKQQKMDHVLDGMGPFQRIKASGYLYEVAGENVAFRPDDLPVKAVMEGWMKSPLHRKNILDKEFTEIGLGGAPDKARTTYYYTQVFGTPKTQAKD